MALVFATVVTISRDSSRAIAETYAANYLRSLDRFQSAYSDHVVARLSASGVTITHDYRDKPGAIPIPATFSIELAKTLTDPDSGLVTRLYSDYPFALRADGGPKDAFERDALAALRGSTANDASFLRYEDVNGVPSIRYARPIVMQAQCVACHNVHPESPKHDWKVGDVRGVRAVALPLDGVADVTQRGWLVTLVVMLALVVVGATLVFVIVQALRASVSMLSTTNHAYTRFVPHEFLAYLRKQSIVEVALNDNVEKEMTVLFSDIRSFTDMSERMTPEENFAFVNEYLSVMGPVVRRNRGFIDKYIGDAIMALFDHPDDAVRASMEMLDELKSYNQARERNDEDPIHIGIGVHTGKLRLGTIGEHHRMDGTVIGDSVNLAARLEGLTKFYGVQCLISGDTYARVSQDDFQLRRIDKVRVKGKLNPVDIFEALGAGETQIMSVKLSVLQQFESAIARFQDRDFKGARELFAAVVATMPSDRAAEMYVQRCDAYILRPPRDDWDGSLQLRQK